MKAATISDIKEELVTLPPKKLLELCLKLAKYKKENKELLTYLIFEAHNESGFVESVKLEIDQLFIEVPKSGWYLIKKGIRKTLRSVVKYSRYTSSKESEVEVLLYFCFKLKNSGIPIQNNKTISNLYNQQIKKLEGLLKGVHQDIVYDYIKQLDQLKQ
jgi:hypothetical protein